MQSYTETFYGSWINLKPNSLSEFGVGNSNDTIAAGGLVDVFAFGY